MAYEQEAKDSPRVRRDRDPLEQVRFLVFCSPDHEAQTSQGRLRPVPRIAWGASDCALSRVDHVRGTQGEESIFPVEAGAKGRIPCHRYAVQDIKKPPARRRGTACPRGKPLSKSRTTTRTFAPTDQEGAIKYAVARIFRYILSYEDKKANLCTIRALVYLYKLVYVSA